MGMMEDNQQPPQRGGAVPDPVWVGSKWLLFFPRVPVTPGTPRNGFSHSLLYTVSTSAKLAVKGAGTRQCMLGNLKTRFAKKLL